MVGRALFIRSLWAISLLIVHENDWLVLNTCFMEQAREKVVLRYEDN
jgi:hypothetical protein